MLFATRKCFAYRKISNIALNNKHIRSFRKYQNLSECRERWIDIDYELTLNAFVHYFLTVWCSSEFFFTFIPSLLILVEAWNWTRHALVVVNSNILHVDLNTQIAPTLPLLPSKNIKRNIAVQRNKFNKLDPVIKIISEGGARVSTISSERQRRYRK